MKIFFKNNWFYIIFTIAVSLFILYAAQGRGDFHIYVSAARDLLLHKNIYTILYNDWFHYFYGVLFAIVLAPISFLPFYVVHVLWLILNVFFLYRIWAIIKEWLPLKLLNDKNKLLLTILTFLFMFRFIRDNFRTGQVTIFMLYIMLEGISLITKEKIKRGAALIAFGIEVKILPVVLLPYLLYRKHYKAFVYTIVFFVGFIFLPSIFIGHDYNMFLQSERYKLLNPTNVEHIADAEERSFHSLTTLFSVLLLDDPGDQYALDIKRNIANVSMHTLSLVINIARAILILFTLFFLKTLPSKKEISNLHRLYELSYIIAIIPLIFPHQQHYAFFLIMPAVSYLLFYMLVVFFHKDDVLVNNKIQKENSSHKKLFVWSMIILFFFTSNHFILGTFREYYDHFKTLTYAGLFLLILLGISNPRNIEKTN